MSQEKQMEIAAIVSAANGKRYRVGRFLGQGVTSKVYEAEDVVNKSTVALKVLRSDVSQIIANNFWLEGTILGALGRAESQAKDGLSNIPRLLGSQRSGQVRFLVLEFVTGTPITRLLEQEEYLPEQDALEVANQVLRVLDLLHQQARRTYTDFQLQNIWLQYDATGQLQGVKVMDWNHVSHKLPEGQPLPNGFGTADLARFAAYFYRMLTGMGADERGETERLLELRAGERWQELSRGTQQLVFRALRPNSQQRFATAAEFRQAVQVQQKLWQSDWIELLADVRAWATTISASNLDIEQAKSVMVALDMAERLGARPEHVAHYQRQLAPHVGEVSLDWKAGQQYYEAGQYRTALSKWRAEAENKEQIKLWRWVMLAQAGVELGNAFDSIRPQAEQAMQALADKQIESAYQLLMPLDSQESPSLEILRKESLARQKVLKATPNSLSQQAEAWQQAALSYREAFAALQHVPYAQLIYSEEKEWPDLAARAEELEQLANVRSSANQAETELKELLNNKFKFEQGRQKLEQQLRLDPTNHRLVGLCSQVGRHLLESGQAIQAEAVLAIGLSLGQVPTYNPQMRESWLEALPAKRFQQEKKKLQEQYEEELEELKKQHQKQLEEERRKHQKEQATLQSTHRNALEEERRKHQEKLAILQSTHDKKIIKLHQKYDAVWGQTRLEIKQKHETEMALLQSQHEQLLTSIQQQNAKQLLEEARKSFDEERWNDFLKLVPKIPSPLLSKERRNWRSYKLHKVKDDFSVAIRGRQVLVAEQLLSLLAVLDPQYINWYEQEYQRMMERLKEEGPSLQSSIKKLIKIEYFAASRPQDCISLVAEINVLLPQTEPNHPALKQWLEQTRQQLQPALRQWQEQLEQLINAGFVEIGKLTRQSLQEAHQLFAQVRKLLAKAANHSFNPIVEAGLTLVRHLTETWHRDYMMSYLQRIRHFRHLQAMGNSQPIISWLLTHPVIQWMEQARRYWREAQEAWANNDPQRAYHLRDLANHLSLIVEALIHHVWWPELMPNDKKGIELSAIRALQDQMQIRRV